MLRSQYEKEGDYVGVQTKFNFAWVSQSMFTVWSGLVWARDRGGETWKALLMWLQLQGLIKSTARYDQQEGVRLLSEIFRASPERRRECLYYLALGNYKLGNYGEARRYNDLLLDKEPSNMQAASLGSLIEEKVNKEGLLGIAIVGGLALTAGLVGGMIFKGAKRR